MTFLRNAMLLGLSAVLLNACGDDSKDTKTTPTTTTLKYADVKALIDSSCLGSGCHSGVTPTGADLSTEAGVRTNAEESAERLEAGTMPQANSAGLASWNEATAKQREDVIAYLKAGAPE